MYIFRQLKPPVITSAYFRKDTRINEAKQTVNCSMYTHVVLRLFNKPLRLYRIS